MSWSQKEPSVLNHTVTFYSVAHTDSNIMCACNGVCVFCMCGVVLCVLCVFLCTNVFYLDILNSTKSSPVARSTRGARSIV